MWSSEIYYLENFITMTTYTLTRSNRKTISIQIREGAVTVRVPYLCPKSEIDRFVHAKSGWIQDKLSKSKEQLAQRESFALNYGDEIVLRGIFYPITARQGSRAGFDGECFYMPLNLSNDQIKATCIKIYRNLAKSYLHERAAYFSAQMNLAPASIKINSAKTRWGSCSSQKNINFSWRLIMADESVIDYVVIHELAHLIHMNHSSKFWKTVENILPDYRERNKRLNELQKRLVRQDWG